MNEYAIELEKVKFTYPRGGFSFAATELGFPAGEITLVTGPNGSGKTTLSKLMCGILRPEDGSLKIFGENAGGWTLGKIGRSIGYLYQEPAKQLFTASVLDEMTFINNLLGLPKEETEKKAMELLRRFGLEKLTKRSTYRLSRGEKQRLALCAVLMQGARFLILDEPTTGLDHENRGILYAVLDSLCEEKIGSAVITHDSGMIARYGTNRITVENGEVLE